MGAEGTSRRWRWPRGLIIVHLSDAESRSCATPFPATTVVITRLLLECNPRLACAQVALLALIPEDEMPSYTLVLE